MRFRDLFTLSMSSAFALLACVDTELHLSPPGVDCDLVWLWLGPRTEADAHPCPQGSLVIWEAWADAVTPANCGPCKCGPAACLLPSQVSAHASICAGEGTSLAFDAGEGWDGSCTERAAPIPGDAVASVTYEPSHLAPCTPSPTPRPPSIIGTFARACKAGEGLPSGYHMCINPEPDGSCDAGFPVRRELFELTDNRSMCTACECGEPSGGQCTAQITLYKDTECSNRLEDATITHTDQPLCQDVTQGPLAAMQARWIESEPGACEPKTAVSTVFGMVTQVKSHVKCCVD